MRFALVATIIIAAAACSDDEATDCGDACQTTEENFGLGERSVHDARSKTFASEGIDYHLIRIEYGETPECDEFDEDCTYSTYCGWVVDAVDYPMEVYWVTDADALFPVTDYCEEGVDIEDCELPGQTLPILEDEAFEDWMYETDPDENILVDCFNDYW